MDTTYALKLFSIILIASFLFNILFLIIAIPLGRYEKKHTPKAEFEPDRIVYYCYRHSKGFRFLVRFICVFAFWVHIPLLAPGIIFGITSSSFEMGLLGILVIWILSFICYILSFKIGRDAPIKYFELTSKGLKITFSNKKIPSSFYPIGCYKGYEPDLSKLVFADSSGNVKNIPLKYLSGDDKISVTGELAYLKKNGILRYSKNKMILTDQEEETTTRDSKVIPSSKGSSTESAPSMMKSAFKPISVPVVEKKDTPPEPVPVKKEPVVQADPEEKILTEHDTLEENVKPVEEKKQEKTSKASSSMSSGLMIPDLRILRNRIFIKNTYRTDMQKVIDSYNDKHADDSIVTLSCDSYPGSAWMYIELIYDENQDKDLIFRNSLDVLNYVKVLDKEMFLYMEGTEGCIAFQDEDQSEDRYKLISSGKLFSIDISVQKIEKLQADEPFDDLKAYIKDKYRLDV